MQQLNSGVGNNSPIDSKNIEEIVNQLLNGVLDVSVTASALPTGAASVALQQSILKQLQNTASSVWTDNTGTYYIRRDNVDANTGIVTVTYTTPTGDPATPGAGLKPASAAGGGASSSTFELVSYWMASSAGTGYAAGDTLAKITVLDASTSPPTIVLTAWENVATGALLSTAPSNIALQSQSDLATEDTLATGVGSNPPPATGLTDVPPNSGKGTLGWLSGLYNQAKSNYGTDTIAATQAAGGAGILGWLSSLVISAGSNPPAASGLVDVPPNSGKGILGWLSGLYNLLGKTQRTYKITVGEVSAGSSLTIPAGRQQIDVANIGTANATVRSASMASASNLYPVQLGGAALTFRAADAGTLEALTITCPAGAVVQFTTTE